MSDSYPLKRTDESEEAAPPRRALGDPTERASIESTVLLQGGRELMIRHGSECYRLRLTRLNKLILTK